LFNTHSPKAVRSWGFTNNIKMKFLSHFFSVQMGVSDCAQYNVISTSEQGSWSAQWRTSVGSAAGHFKGFVHISSAYSYYFIWKSQRSYCNESSIQQSVCPLGTRAAQCVWKRTVMHIQYWSGNLTGTNDEWNCDMNFSLMLIVAW
jgi:hypothetical protein